VIVVNTCSFIDPAKQESSTPSSRCRAQDIRRAKKLESLRGLPWWNANRGDIQKDLPEVDALIGTNEFRKKWSRSAKASQPAPIQ